MKNRRGQFFLVAAIIIIGIVIVLASSVNSVRVGNDQESFYDLSEEIGFETKQVLDYGVFDVNAETVDILLLDFLQDYANYIAGEETLFVYGDSNGVQGLIFMNGDVGNVGLITGTAGNPSVIEINDITGQKANVIHNLDLVSVEINGIVYDFKLKKGENFFFVIIKTEDGERFVAQG
jgi:hypothetical protein